MSVANGVTYFLQGTVFEGGKVANGGACTPREGEWGSGVPVSIPG